MSEILLSICIAGRNDNYGYNFKYRFVQSMNQLAYAAKKANIFEQIEVVFADWNSEVPLASEIVLSEDAAKLVRFIETPPEIAKKYNPSFSPFSQSVAFNTALHRTNGKFIGIMPGDILFTSWSLRNLFLLLQDPDFQSVMLSIPRKNIPFQYNESLYFTTPEATEKILLSGSTFMNTDNEVRGMMGSYGAFFLPRETMSNLRGVDERIAGWGYNDIDIALRCAGHIRVVNTGGYGVWSYDFEASPQMCRQKKTRATSFWQIEPGYAQNPESWGLSDQILQEHRCTHYSEKNEYPYTPAKPESLSLQEWLTILLSFYPADLLGYVSSAAFAAVILSLEHRIHNVSIFGNHDNSIILALGLLNGFPDLTLHQEIKTQQDFYRLWDNDRKFAAVHYQGNIHYIPSLQFSDSEKPEMLIFDSQYPSLEDIVSKCSKDSILLFSETCGITEQKIQKIASHFNFNVYAHNTIVILSSFQIRDGLDLKPLKKNFLHLLKFNTLNRRFQILLSLLSRYPVVKWGSILQKYRKFRNGELN